MRELPTEIWYSVLSYLDLGDRNCFSKCSKTCYFAAFPIRFKGAHLLLKDGSDSEQLQWFEDGGLLAPLRRHIRAATYYSQLFYSQRIITPPFHHLQSFPNISRVVINLPNDYSVKREKFIAILTSLRTLNYYDDIQELVFQWGGSCAPVGSKMSDAEFVGLALDGLGLPKRLQSFTIESNRIQDPCHLSFLVDCDKVTTLCLTDATAPTMDPRQPDTILAFSTIKKLTLQYTEDNDNAHEYLQLLSIQFPKLESLTISLAETIPISDYRHKSYFKYITGLSSLTDVEIPFPKTYCMGRTMSICQSRLRKCFAVGGITFSTHIFSPWEITGVASGEEWLSMLILRVGFLEMIMVG
ncbi:hypothetical protein TWF281_004517 [Arthrobotrys megalospora]